jgi:hypothetical protein
VCPDLKLFARLLVYVRRAQDRYAVELIAES